ncbi:hypothetical protein GCM10008965_54490 [Methylorubrum aminovorans]
MPEPEGPQTTTTSPRFTAVEQPVRTRTSPYHFDTASMAIIGPLAMAGCGAELMGAEVMGPSSSRLPSHRTIAVRAWSRRTSSEAAKQTAK